MLLFTLQHGWFTQPSMLLFDNKGEKDATKCSATKTLQEKIFRISVWSKTKQKEKKT